MNLEDAKQYVAERIFFDEVIPTPVELARVCSLDDRATEQLHEESHIRNLWELTPDMKVRFFDTVRNAPKDRGVTVHDVLMCLAQTELSKALEDLKDFTP